MRITVFGRHGNPLLRKSEVYAIEQVEVLGRADWVDSADHSKGIIAREMLYFGPPAYTEPQRTYSIDRTGKLKFVLPERSRIARAASQVLMVRPIMHQAL